MINFNVIPKKESFYIRQERSKYRIISDLGYEFSLLINSSAKNILNSINGVDKFGEILKDLYEQYPEINQKTIYEDTNKLMLSFLKSKVITLNKNGGELYMDIKEIYRNDDLNIKVIHFSELNFNDILSFLKYSKSRKTILNEFEDLTHNELTIREALFSYREEFYGLYEDGCLKGLVSYKRKSSLYGNYFRNGTLTYLNSIEELGLNCLLKASTKDIINENVYNCKIIRFSFIEKKDNHIAYLLKNIGYKSVINESSYFIGDCIEYLLDYKNVKEGELDEILS